MPSFKGHPLREVGQFEFPEPGTGVWRTIWGASISLGVVTVWVGSGEAGARLKGEGVLLRGSGSTLGGALRDLEHEAEKAGL